MVTIIVLSIVLIWFLAYKGWLQAGWRGCVRGYNWITNPLNHPQMRLTPGINSGQRIWLLVILGLSGGFAAYCILSYGPLLYVVLFVKDYLQQDFIPGLIASGALLLYFLINYGNRPSWRKIMINILIVILVFMTVTWLWNRFIADGLTGITKWFSSSSPSSTSSTGSSWIADIMNWAGNHSLWILGAVAALAFLIVLARSEELQKSLSKIALALILVGGVSYAIHLGEKAIRAADYNPAARKASGGKEIVKDYAISTEEPIKIEWAADSSTIIHLEFGKTVAGMYYWHQNRKPDDEAPAGIITPDGVENPPIKGDDPVWIAMIAPEGIDEPLEGKVEIVQRLYPK